MGFIYMCSPSVFSVNDSCYIIRPRFVAVSGQTRTPGCRLRLWTKVPTAAGVCVCSLSPFASHDSSSVCWVPERLLLWTSNHDDETCLHQILLSWSADGWDVFMSIRAEVFTWGGGSLNWRHGASQEENVHAMTTEHTFFIFRHSEQAGLRTRFVHTITVQRAHHWRHSITIVCWMRLHSSAAASQG